MKPTQDVEHLQKIANDIRIDTMKSLIAAGSGHSAGPLGMADVMTALYFAVAKIDPKKPEWDERDYVLLSNGHICPVLYAVMAHRGYFPKSELKTLRKFGSKLQGHPHRESLHGLETSSGPLGSGISQAAGIALGLKMDGKSNNVWCMTGDGELNEGNVWEGVQFAGAKRLSKLTVIVDRNNIQIDGDTEDVMPLESLRDKFESFGWHVEDINGHSFPAIISALEEAKAIQEKPVCIIANTIPGKGVEFMEDDYRWHGAPPGKGPENEFKKTNQGKEALKDLRELGGRITCHDCD